MHVKECTRVSLRLTEIQPSFRKAGGGERLLTITMLLFIKNKNIGFCLFIKVWSCWRGFMSK